MGTSHAFPCPRCGYQTELPRGDDVRHDGPDPTIHCHTCRRLYDVITADRSVAGDLQPREPRCPRSADDNIERWAHPGPCPRGGATMG